MKSDVRKEVLEKGQIVPIVFDYVFTSIFNKPSNIVIIENFLSCYFEIPLEEIKGNVEILSRNLELENKKTATKEVDLLLQLGKQTINIELSTQMSSGIMERNVVFTSNIHARDYHYGDSDYSNIGATIQVNLIYDKSYHGNKEFKESYYFRNDKGKILSKKLRIDLLDMVIGKKLCYTNNESKLARWCRVFTAKTEEEFEEAIGDLMEKKAEKQLKEEVKRYSQDKEVIQLYSKYTKEELERNTLIHDAKQDGIEEGIKQGIEQGLQQGVEQKSIEVAKNMLKENMSISIITKVTGLSEKQIEELQ